MATGCFWQDRQFVGNFYCAVFVENGGYACFEPKQSLDLRLLEQDPRLGLEANHRKSGE